MKIIKKDIKLVELEQMSKKMFGRLVDDLEVQKKIRKIIDKLVIQ